VPVPVPPRRAGQPRAGVLYRPNRGVEGMRYPNVGLGLLVILAGMVGWAYGDSAPVLTAMFVGLLAAIVAAGAMTNRRGGP
jgi:hypothetical protein